MELKNLTGSELVRRAARLVLDRYPEDWGTFLRRDHVSPLVEMVHAFLSLDRQALEVLAR